MEKIDYKNMINQFLDGELEKRKERELFEVLAHDEECRDYFKQINMIKSVAHEDQTEFPGDLEERIMYSVGALSEKSRRPSFFKNRIFAFAAYAAALVSVGLSVHLYTVTDHYKSELELTNKALWEKNKVLDMMYYNQTPTIRVSGYKHGRFDYPYNITAEELEKNDEKKTIDASIDER